ncbi:hypothetical protein [Paenibacillus sp.]|uniref:hypothetical protein n=1 Tax=Paenibacillus sp. TaxID=58172 RepID=UPI002D5C5BCC|nr:hypothetical protein [Paenibacillus sp.]HZG87692.1 hypothetical protein [Paenibacillus sp.]
MRKFNFTRPLLILLVAFVANNLAKFICLSFGIDPATTENVAMMAMVLAALLAYMRLTRHRRK